jgi:PKD domain-containing protein
MAMAEGEAGVKRGFGGRRGASTATAAVILVLIMVIAGVGTFFAFNQTSKPTCQPAGSAVCVSNVHDVNLLVPLRASQQGATIPFTASLPGGETSSDFSFSFGDGIYDNHTSATTVDHIYTQVGTYLATVTAVVSGLAHDSYHSIVPVVITASYASNSLGTYPSVGGSITSNTSATSGASAFLSAGNSVTVQGVYSLGPTNPLYKELAPTISAPGGTVSGLATTNSSATATVSFGSPGIYTITYVAAGVPVSGTGAAFYENYTWTAVVSPTSQHYALIPISASTSPHKNEILAYEEVPGGAKSYDPAIDYESAGFEVIYNTYQSLITYNGSKAGPDPANFVPVLATCVPGSTACGALYGGNTLIQGSNYTFVINHASKFYDAKTGASWGVYPTDVMFSVLRTEGFSLYPGVATTAGWILTQSIVPACNLPPAWYACFSWDGGLHPYFNNTPTTMFESMSINSSANCPAAAMTNDHGCITFHANAASYFGGPGWPFFLELIADVLGAGITPAGWFSASTQGSGIPYWTQGNVSGSGDHPVALPTGATTTDNAAYQSFVKAIPVFGFDSWESSYVHLDGSYAGNTWDNVAGSGPYFYNTSGSVFYKSYELTANPAYVQNPYCTWTGCQPAPGQYAHTVQVIWEDTATPGESALASGVADVATIPAQDTAFLLQQISAGKAQALNVPTLDIFQVFFAYNFSVPREHQYTANPVNIPSDFFSYVGLRQFMAHAYPYATIESTINTVDGIQYGFDQGGAIPDFMDGYSPSNIKWPSGNPCTDASNSFCATYWWNAIKNPSSPYYDPQIAACTPASPCQFPLYGELGIPDEDERLTLFIDSVSSLTGGAIQMSLVDITFAQQVTESFASQPTALPMNILGWLPDYPDPTDYTVPYYYPDSTYTFAGMIAEYTDSFNSTLPGTSTACPTDYNYYVNITTTGPYPSVPQSCVGAAYDAEVGLLFAAAPLNPGPLRIQLFDYAEIIANQLAQFITELQANTVWTFATWLNPTTVNTNVMIGSGDWVWYATGGSGVY